MSLAAQPAAIQAHSCAAQITAACRIAGVAVDAVDGDTCIKLTAFVVLHFVYTALKACVILTETTVIITVSTQLTAIVAGPDAAFSRFGTTAQLTHTFHNVVAFDPPNIAQCQTRVITDNHRIRRSNIFVQIDFTYPNLCIINYYSRCCRKTRKRVIHYTFLPNEITQCLTVQVSNTQNYNITAADTISTAAVKSFVITNSNVLFFHTAARCQLSKIKSVRFVICQVCRYPKFITA